MRHYVGDIVFYENDSDRKFIIEEVSNDVRNPWIWSSGLAKPYLSNGVKNLHPRYSFDLGKLVNLSRKRQLKLKELGI
jgi:hypothetical protein